MRDATTENYVKSVQLRRLCCV